MIHAWILSSLVGNGAFQMCVTTSDVVVFEIGPGRYAIPLADAVECVRMPAIVPLPKAPAVVEGIVDLRGTVVPVLDIRRRFGLPARWRRPARLVALRVDKVLGIEDMDPNQQHSITPRPVVEMTEWSGKCRARSSDAA